MNILEKIALILLFGFVIFIWNKYAIRGLIQKVAKINPEHKWLTDKRHTITKVFQGFYWLVYIMITIGILFSH